jgi:acyl-CoA-binding protein
MDSMRDNCSDVMHLREKKNPRQLFNLSFSYLQARAGDNQMRRFYWVV